MTPNDQLNQVIQENKLDHLKDHISKTINFLDPQKTPNGLELGEKAPLFCLKDQYNNSICLSDYLNKGPVILSFIRGSWCHFCTEELKSLKSKHMKMQEINATLLVITPQPIEDNYNTALQFNVDYPILSDPDQNIIKNYNIQYYLPSDIQNVYKNYLGVDVSQRNSDHSTNLPIPATYILDQKGIIRSKYVSMNYTIRMDKDKILDELQSMAYFEAIFRNAPMAMMIVDQDGVVIDHNQAMNRIFNDPEDRSNIGLNILSDPYLKTTKAYDVIKDVFIDGKQKSKIENVTIRSDKSDEYRIVNITASQLIIAGKTRGFIVLMDDVTEKVLQARELEQAKAYFEAIFQNAPLATYILDKDGYVKDYNPAAKRLFPKPRECEEEDVDITRINPLNDPIFIESGLSELAKQALTNKETFGELRHIKVDSRYLNFIGASLTIQDEIIGAIGVFDDVTEKVLQSKQLENALEELKIANQQLIQSENKYKKLIETAGDAIFLIDGNNQQITDANKKAEELLGRSHQEMIGFDYFDFFRKETDKTYLEKFKCQEMRKKIDTIQRTCRIIHKNGLEIPVDVTVSAIEIDGKLLLQAILRDISQQKEYEQKLKESEEFFRLIAEHSSDLISKHTSDMDATFLYVSPSSRSVLGYNTSELLGKSPYEFLHPDDISDYKENHSIVLRGSGIIRFSYRWSKKNGEYIWCESSAQVMRHPITAQIEGIITVTRNITERKESEDKIRQVASFAEYNPAPIIRFSNSGKVIMANPACVQVLGINPKQEYQIDDILPGIKDLNINIKDFINKNNTTEFTSIIENQYYQFTIKGLNDLNVVHVYGSNITALKQAETQVIKQEQVYRQLIETMNEGLIKQDENGFITFANRKLYEMTGYSKEEIIGKIPSDSEWHVRDNPSFSKFLSQAKFGNIYFNYSLEREIKSPEGLTRTVYEFPVFTTDLSMTQIIEKDIKRKDGSILHVYVSPNFIMDEKGQFKGVTSVVTDITDRKKAEISLRQKNEELEHALNQLKKAQVQLVQSEKLASLGQLLAGIAHEMNNPVNFISSGVNTLSERWNEINQLLNKYDELDNIENMELRTYIEQVKLLKKHIYYDETVQDINVLLKGILEGSQRTVKIINDLKQFSRTQQKEIHNINMNEYIDSNLNLLSNQFKNRIEIIKEYTDDAEIDCHPDKINQVLMNILSNAIQAIPEKGKITIKTEKLSQYLKITISDTGIGIPKKNLSKVFDPFFTTKEVGKGTGLGLSISYEIIKNHNGKIIVESEEKKGTQFIIKLPIIHKEGI